MEIIISNSSGVPIYEQIKEQIKAKIISNELKANELLPSIRSLAKDLRCSVITTKNAYEELVHEGYVISVSTPPRLSAKLITLSVFSSLLTISADFILNEITEPNPVLCDLLIKYPGWSSQVLQLLGFEALNNHTP